ncbi:hypothetical protein FF100_27635 [Methylobacterium terricola]|uniref:DUF6894 domain-containing protein n=1 Tax=Methylobacterium terricola TaxID=2583531 RepID=A0A5C4LCE4_9HYPH|nr:hypothetical protein [Methylobacterium terricola]TNC09075.1 hypothetical protein FF100_27635 [Methylobacterium terricola]
MPRFFFDIKDDHLETDDVGSEFPNAHAARDAAIMILPNIARDHIASHVSREISVLMRDEAGRGLFTASLGLTAEWLVESA